jgi:hypothetical protein
MNRFLLYPFIDNKRNNALWLLLLLLLILGFINYFALAVCLLVLVQSSVISFLLVLVLSQ